MKKQHQARLQLLKTALKDQKLHHELESAFTKANGDWNKIHSNLKDKKHFDSMLNKLALTDLTGNHTPLITTLLKHGQTNDKNILHDIATNFDRKKFVEKVTSAPKDFKPDDTKNRVKIYANKVYDKLFHLEPTAVITRMVDDRNESLHKELNTKQWNKNTENIATFLRQTQKEQNFNIKTDSIYKAFQNEKAFENIPEEEHEQLITALKSLQRVVALSPVPEVIPELMKTNMTSALRISDLPEAQFIKAFSKSLDKNGVNGEEIAKQTHYNAVNARIRNEQALMALKESGQGTGIALIDKSLSAYKRNPPAKQGAGTAESPSKFEEATRTVLEKHNLSWDLLFGDTDFCECGECTSVYSPAAYFVELLQYLRNNNLDPNPANDPSIQIKSNLKDISGTPLQKLFDRRPDLGCLELTCRNTNTILPYVDLANEIMESYIAHGNKPYNIPFNVEEDETSGELLAQPHHTQDAAYKTLKDEVYPFTLPYHQPIDAVRIYLDYLGTSRSKLIDIFRSVRNGTDTDEPNDDPAKQLDPGLDDTVLADNHEKYINRAVDAEYLGLTQEEYVILTKEAFVSKDYWEKQNKANTLADYKKTIGVKEPYEYYGYNNVNEMLDTDESKEEGLTFVKKQFLRRTGIEYVDLVELLKTQSLNPNMPQDKALTIMESIRFSYQFLQTLVIKGTNDPRIKFEKLIEFVEKNQFRLPLLKRDDPCSPKEDKTRISPTEFENWVYKNFENIGKIIVLDNGKKCNCIEGRFQSMTIRDDKGKEISRGQVKINKKCKIILKESGNNPETVIGQMNCSNGELIGGTLHNRKVDFRRNREPFVATNGRKGELIKGMLYDIETKSLLIELRTGLDSCDLDTVRLIHLDGSSLKETEYNHIQRFIRLWRKLGWTIDEVDNALVGLGEVKDFDSFNISPDFLHQLEAVKKLLDKTGLEVIKLLTFWTDISTKGENSLYKRVFLTHNLLAIDSVFKADNNGGYLLGGAKISEHLPVIMAAFNLSSEDIEAIIKKNTLPNPEILNIENLSFIYRHRLLAKVLGLRIPAFLDILPLFGDIFNNADATLKFMKRWGKMEDAGFNYRQLNYIIKDFDDPKKPLSPTEKTILQLAKKLYDGLNAIDEVHKDLTADPLTIIPKDKELEIQAQATLELVRSKASLLFDSLSVDKIIGILEGTNVFSTNAPKDLVIKIDDGKTLNKKLKYNKTDGTIQITGILTQSETIEFKALTNDLNGIPNPDWLLALTRLEKKQSKLFKEVLSAVFESEKAKLGKSKTDAEAAEKTIQDGDINLPIDNNTAAPKRTALLTVFMPYLRQELSHRFVVETLSNSVGLESKITDALISEILQSCAPAAPIYTIFQKIKDSAKTTTKDWTGYLIPPADGDYTFIFKQDIPAKLSIDGVELKFPLNPKDDDPIEWWSDTTFKLQTGKLYKLSIKDLVNDIDFKNIYWKTATSPISAVPTSALLPDFTSVDLKPVFVALKKVAYLVTNFNLSADEIRHFDKNKVYFDNLDFNHLTLKHWLRLEAYTRLRNSLPETDLNMLGFWKWITASDSTDAQLSGKIAKLTLWKKERIDKLIADKHFKINQLKDFLNEVNLLKMQQALNEADKIGMDIDLLFDWAKPTSDFDKCKKIADSIQNAIRAQYKQTDWEQIVKPLSDKLRNNQKDALIAHLLQQPDLIKWGVTDADGLFEFFLIDVQMDACMETSRIKQALSSVQSFVQRCFLGLEEEHSGIKPEVLDRNRWEWMQRYRVWEANRKIFLYPENWIESNLRDDKSQFFKELESELLQKDINTQNVTDALKAYLYKVDEVANMEVIGLYIDGIRDSDKWNKGAKLHIFSRTRNAPYFFYYRYLDLFEMNWYPWEKMQVDVSNFEEEDTKLLIQLNSDNVIPNPNYGKTISGCYLTPVVWNGRLLIFFPQFMKKTKPNPIPQPVETTKVRDNEGNETDSTITTMPENKPIEFWEIKMAWSEYRNGKWTQKQLSLDALQIDIIPGRAIDQFTFIPVISDANVIIHIEDQAKDDAFAFNGFTFSGSFFNKDNKIGDVPLQKNLPSSIVSHFGGATVFQKTYSSNKIQSMQLKKNIFDWGNDDASFKVENNSVTVDYPKSSINSQKFYHSDTHDLLSRINTGQLKDFFEFNTKEITTVADKNEAFGGYINDSEHSYHELKRPYSIYNWELFLHKPMLLGDALSKSQHFEEAIKWYNFVFDPTSSGSDDKRFWQFAPFKEIDSQNILDAIFNNLNPNTKDDAINEWRNNPFKPHLVARSRPVAYMKWVVMKYIDNLIAWGDYLFRQDTIESINQATQLYILAGHILGPRPMLIPKRGKIKPQTYKSLLDKWDAFGNAMVELEITAPFSNQITTPVGNSNGVVGLANVFGFGTSLYFCIPNNPKLMGYWDTIADRLFKIRHCENIEGIFRKLPLFEPPIDPALLVNAAAQGLSIESVLNDLNTPMPNYRFYYLLQKALELCNELKSLGGAMLSAIEKKDNEKIALIRAKHESTIHNLVMEIKKQQLEEANKALETLQQNRKSPEHRMKYYLQLIGEDVGKVPGVDSDFSEIANAIETPVSESGLKLIKYEKEDMDKSNKSADLQLASGIIEVLAGILYAIPMLKTEATPIGIGVGVEFGGTNLGQLTQASTKTMQIAAGYLSHQATSAGKKGGFQRALQDRIIQANSAGYEIKQIDKQIVSQQIRIVIANQEIINQQKIIDNANEIEEFLKNKYTNEELYTWMRDNLKTLYHQVYGLAFDLAKKCEKVFRFERGLSSTNFIQAGYWNDSRDGLLSGEQLYVGLKQMEAAYQENLGYDYEIPKHISLRQINPLAVLQLKETGKCEFTLPEVLFDMDFPGHYKRRIKSVSLSIPCVAGPYTNINATLRLLENKFRNTAIVGNKYSEDTENTDGRFSTYIIPISAIAVGSAQNDSGRFELNFKDERYLPFEGAGVTSKWRLELPDFRQFDYDTISDAVIHLLYISNEGGERLKKAAGDTVQNFIKKNDELGQQEGLFAIIDLQHDLPTEWHQAMQNKAADNTYKLSIPNVQSFLPLYATMSDGKTPTAKTLKATDINVLCTDFITPIKVGDNSGENLTQGVQINNLKIYSTDGLNYDLKNLELTFDVPVNIVADKTIPKAWMVIRFILQ